MLTEKNYRDFCDEETENELVKLGFPIEHACLQGSGIYVTIHISLYEAQKWLREEKDIVVRIIPLYEEGKDIKGMSYTNEVIHWDDGYVAEECIVEYDSFEEALSEGIKEAVKILKGEEK